MKIFKFTHSEGLEILAANNAKEAIMFYFTKYQDDLNTDEIVEYEGIQIKQLNDSEINTNYLIFNEETNTRESVSYKELAEKEFNGEVLVLVTPNY